MLSEAIQAFYTGGSPEAFDTLVREHGAETVLLKLMQWYPSLPLQGQLAEKMKGAACLTRQGKPVHTIGVFYYRASRGGTERVMCDLIRLWNEAGYRTVLLTDFPAGADDEPLPESTKRLILPDTFALTGESRQERFRALQKACREEGIDCLVHHAWLSKNLLWDLLAVKSLGIPAVVYTHSSPSCLLMDEDPDNMDELPHLTRIMGLADRVICLSRAFEAFWHRFNPHTALLLNPCLSPAERMGGARSLPAPGKQFGKKQLIWAGRFSPEKQPEEALRILAEVRKAVPEARLALLGSGGETYRDLEARLREQVRTGGLAGAVDMPGFIPDPTPWYEQSSVLLLTSLYEGFSLVIAEAKMHGIPTVMYDMPYLYFREEGRGVAAVSPQDAGAAARAAVKWMTDPAAYEQASREALESSRSFSPETLQAQWRQLFSCLTRPEEAAEPAAAEPETAAWNMVLSQLHAGLTGVAQKETARLRDAAGGLMNSIFDAKYYAAHNPDLKAAFGEDDIALLRHYLEFGMAEGRQASPLFRPQAYAARYPDLKAAFGSDYRALALHFLLHGRQENRIGC